MSIISLDIIQQVEKLSQENYELSRDIHRCKEYISKLDLEYNNLSDYQNQTLIALITKDILIIFVSFAVLLVISAVLSILRLTPIVAGFWILLLLGLAFLYFKLILTAIILMAIATFMLDNEPSSIVIGVNTIILIATFLVFRIYTIHKNKSIINHFDELNYLYSQNTEYILHLLYEPLNNHIQSAGLVNINSIQDNGFSFVEKEYLQKYLLDEVKRKNLKINILQQSKTALYQSTKPSEMAEMTTTHLQID